MASLSPRQLRNQKGQAKVLPGGPTLSSADGMLGEVQAAMVAANANSFARQLDAKAWMDAPLASPPPSGDRQPTHGEPGHMPSPTFGVGQHPGTDLLPPAAGVSSRLPAPQPRPAPVATSVSRPVLSTGFYQSRPKAEGGPVFVSVSEGPQRRSLLQRLFGRLLGGGK